MTCATGTIECDPLWTGTRADNDGASSGKPFRDLVRRVHIGDDAPTEDGQPLPPRDFLHAGHTCSKNGLVIPSPSLPLSGWQ